MALFAQHGYGKSNKIESGFSSNLLSGVILSPKDETPQNMASYISHLRKTYPSKQVFLDPQFYVSTLSPVNAGKFVNYPYYQTNLTRRNFISGKHINTYVKQTLDYQLGTDVTHVLSPTVLVDNFSNQWGQISLSLADQSQTYMSNYPDRSLLISLCLDENAFRDLNALNEFLDVISLMEVRGFYINVARNNRDCNPQIFPGILEGIMHMAYSLATLNEYQVYFGYTSFLGVPLHAVGVTATACGWYNTLKRFQISHFQPATKGRTPRPRYSSSQLLNSILIVPELDTISRSNINVLSNTSYDKIIRANPANAPWTAEISCLHHWETLNGIFGAIESKNGIVAKLDYVTILIQNAQNLYDKMSQIMVFDPNSGPNHLCQWSNAIKNFRATVGV